MKESEYNEIDSLLRNLAGRERSLPAELSGGQLSATSAHLDADELSAYAEGALPPSTRARYTAHVADCDDCRRIVAQLSIAAGPLLDESRARQDSAISGWRQFLAALFTSASLRYAMPALALVVVAAFALIAWRQQREASLVARNRQSESSNATRPASDMAKENPGSVAHPPSERDQTNARPQSSPAATLADKVSANDKKTAAGALPDSSRAASPKEADSSKESKEKDAPRNEVAAVSQPSYAPELAAAPPPKPTVSTVAKAPAKVADDKVETKDSIAARRGSEKSPSVSGAATENVPVASNQAARQKTKALPAGRAAANRRADEEGGSETRTVSGRRFQRRNGAWVDTAYKSSLSTTSIARGSEQYRALISDEPGIDAVAKQLSGEVILVWKGRAYRIR